jgi:lambda family phage tail tape measure protein
MLQIEQEFLFDRRQAWLQATDQNIKAIEERRDAEIEALKEMELSEKGAAEARRLIWETAAQDIIDIEKQKNLTITNSLEELNEGFKGAFEGQLDTFIEDLTRGELSFKNFVNAIISEVNRLTARQLSKEISQALFGGGQGAGGGSGLGTLLGLAGTALGALGGGGLASTAGGYGSTVVSGAELTAYGAPLRQRGGPVVPGQAYLVGESGAELFRSASAGEIIPNDQIGSGRPVVVNMTINTPDANSFRASQSQIAAETSVALRRADARGN